MASKFRAYTATAEKVLELAGKRQVTLRIPLTKLAGFVSGVRRVTRHKQREFDFLVEFTNGKTADATKAGLLVRCPIAMRKDELRIRERYRMCVDDNSRVCIRYEADKKVYAVLAEGGGEGDIVKRSRRTTSTRLGKPKAASTMPYWASRYRYKVDDVKVVLNRSGDAFWDLSLRAIR